MRKKFYILIEDDWELFGNGLGNVASIQYLPSIFLMNLASKLSIKLTFMVDVAQQLAFIRHQKSNPNLGIQIQLWDKTVCLMKEKGFDVQLHLHPQWVNASYKDGFFFVGENWNIGACESSVRRQLLKESIEYLESLLKPIDSNYRVHSFKAGSWGLQPSEGILEDLSGAGIKNVIGVRKDLKIPSQKIDYGGMEEDTLPYNPAFGDIRKISQGKNKITVLPLVYYHPNFSNLAKLIFQKTKNRFFQKQRLSSEMEATCPEAIRSLKPLKIQKSDIWNRLFTTHLKIGDQPFSYMKASFDHTIDRLRQYDVERIPVVIESHTKNYINNYDNVEKFIRYIFEKYENEIEFYDLTTFLNDVENKKFYVRSHDEL